MPAHAQDAAEDVRRAVEEAAAEARRAVEDAVDNGAVAAAEPPAPADPAAPFAITARISGVSFNHSIHFDQNGQQQGENSNLSVNFRVLTQDDRQMLSHQNVRVTRAVTDAGEDLANPDANRHHGGFHRNIHHVIQNRHHHRGDIHGHAQLTPPTLPATTLTEVTGVMSVQLGVGPMRQAVLGPFAKVDGRRARIDGIEGSHLLVDEHQGNLRVEVSGAVMAVLNRIRVFDENGNELTPNGWSSGNNQGRQHVTLNLPPAPGHRVVFELFDRVDEVEAEFTMTDVPLPVLERRPAGPELVLHTEPLNEAKLRGALPEVPVIVEDQ